MLKSFAFWKTAAGGSLNLWQDLQDPATANTDGANSANQVASHAIVAAHSGTIDKLRIYIKTRFGVGNVKMGLYRNDKTFFTGANGIGADPGAGNQWLEVVLGTPPTVVSGTTYILAWDFDSGNLNNAYDSGSGALSFDTLAYTSFPGDPLINSVGPFTRNPSVGMHFV